MREWKSYEALEETIRRDTEKVAEALHQSPSLVRKWKEPPRTDEDFTQSGARNPLDRLEIIIKTIEQIDPERAYIPIRWLCARFGFMPPVKMPRVADSEQELVGSILEWTKEFGETSRAVSEALKDGRVSKEEYKKIWREFTEDIEAGLSLLMRLKEMAGHE